jgi:hypothetical protein
MSKEPRGGNLTDWVRHHDRYGAGGRVAETGRYVPASEIGECCHKGTEKSAAK